MQKKKTYRYSTGESFEADAEDLKRLLRENAPVARKPGVFGQLSGLVRLIGRRRVRGPWQRLLRPQIQRRLHRRADREVPRAGRGAGILG